MATSDLHMQVTDYDYVRDAPGSGGSFAKLATLIKAARAEADRVQSTCLLFDNGDTFQGTPVSDVMAQEKRTEAHPMPAIMQALGYDAAGLGNHDLDYGLDHLAACLSQLTFPIVCSNMKTAHLPMLRQTCMLERDVQDCAGTSHKLQIGLVSSLPDKTALWSRFHLEDKAVLQPPLPSIRTSAAALRAQGADLIIVLAHMGIALFDEGPDAQNQINEVARINDVDLIVGGHTHLRFPGPDHADVHDVDIAKGTVHGKPVVQPGAAGTDLGVIDLRLTRSDAGRRWSVATETVRLVSTTDQTAPDADVTALAAPAHERTRHYLSAEVARLANPMHSYFALADPSPLTTLFAQAKLMAIREATAGTEYASLPLLAAASSPLSGGLDGPENFIFLDKGPLQRRHIAGMNPYANNVWAVKTTGAQIVDWLERSALIFTKLVENAPDQPLIDARVPGFRYDAIYGLEYSIDPREAARFDAAGTRRAGTEGRIKSITWDGKPLDPAQSFLVAVTDHRAGGGGLYKPFASEEIVVRGSAPVQEVVLRYLQREDCSVVRGTKPWRFVPDMNRSAVLFTAPDAADHLNDIAHLHPEPCGVNAGGFLKVRLHL